MGQRIALIAAWFAATAVAVLIASAAVGAVRGEVTDQPQSAEPFLPAPAVVDTTTTTTPAATTTTPDTTSSSTSSTSTTSTSIPDEGTTTTTQPQGSTTTTTTAPPASTTTSTTTTQPEAPTQLPPYQLVGGTVTIAVSEPNVWLVGAVPSVGFAADVEYTGPEKVEVEFESADTESKVRAKWEDGKLIVDIDEE